MAARIAGVVGGVASFVAISVVGIALQLSYFTVNHFALPVGSDTAAYLWRSRLAGALGLNAIPGSSPFEFRANSANPDRLGLPALAAVLRWTTNVGPYRLMFVLPAICAAVLGLAVFALARSMQEPRWSAAVWGFAGATSVALAVTARGYLDNVLVDPLLMAAAAALLLSMELDGPVVAAVLLLIAAILVHYLIAGLMLGIFVVFGLVLLPWSRCAWRDGKPMWKTPSGRVGTAVGTAALFGAIGLVTTPGAHAYADKGRSGYSESLRIQLPAYRLRLTLPLAILGAVGLGLRGGRARLRGLALMMIWGGAIALGWILYSLGRSIPIQRLLGMAFPLTVLGAAAFTSLLAFAIRHKGRVRLLLGAAAWAMVVMALVMSVRLGRDALSGGKPMWSAQMAAEARTAVTYLDRAKVDGAVIVVAKHAGPSDFGGGRAFRRMRAIVPGDQVANVAVYVGDPERLLAGQPTVDPGNPQLTAASKLYWDALGGFVAPDTVIMVVRPFDQDYGALAKAHPDWEVAPGVLVVKGPPTPTLLAVASPPTAPTARDLVTWAVLPLVLFLIVGSGWAVSFLPLGWAERTALAPALGMAAIIVVAYAGGMAGVSMHGRPPVILAMVAAALGWIPVAVRLHRRQAEPSVPVPHRKHKGTTQGTTVS